MKEYGFISDDGIEAVSVVLCIFDLQVSVLAVIIGFEASNFLSKGGARQNSPVSK